MAEQRISYDDISASCDELREKASSLNDSLKTVQEAIKTLSANWEGEAASKFIESFNNFAVKNLEDAKRILAESVLFLVSCSDGYKALDEKHLTQLRDLVGKDFIDSYNAEADNEDIDLDHSYVVDLDAIKEGEENGETDNTEEDSNKEGEVNTLLNNVQRSQNDVGSTYSGDSSTGGYSYNSGGGTQSVSSVTPIAPIAPITPSNNTENTQKLDETTVENETSNTVTQKQYQTSKYDNNQFADDSKEKSVEALWKKQGLNNHDGIATVSISDENRYLVKVDSKYGNVGDSIDLSLEDGSVVKCVIAENQSIENSTSANGSSIENSNANIVQFETTNTDNVKYSWDTTNRISKVTNNGNALTNSSNKTAVIEGKTYPPTTLDTETNSSTQSSTIENNEE